MILYQVWTGKKPWDKLTPPDIEAKVVGNQRPETSGLDDKLKSLIEKCWHELADKRPSFDDILAILTQ